MDRKLTERLREAGDDYTIAWGSGELYDEAASELERLREALERLRDWGGLPGGDHYSGTVAADVMRWVRSGMSGPLPPMPEWATENGPNVGVEGPP